MQMHQVPGSSNHQGSIHWFEILHRIAVRLKPYCLYFLLLCNKVQICKYPNFSWNQYSFYNFEFLSNGNNNTISKKYKENAFHDIIQLLSNKLIESIKMLYNRIVENFYFLPMHCGSFYWCSVLMDLLKFVKCFYVLK